MKETRPLCNISETASHAESEPSYSEDGVDLTLIRWMLSLTPSERLEVLQKNVQSLARLCDEASRA